MPHKRKLVPLTVAEKKRLVDGFVAMLVDTVEEAYEKAHQAEVSRQVSHGANRDAGRVRANASREDLN